MREVRLRSTAVTIPRLERYRCRHDVHLSTVLVLNDNGSTAGVTGCDDRVITFEGNSSVIQATVTPVPVT